MFYKPLARTPTADQRRQQRLNEALNIADEVASSSHSDRPRWALCILAEAYRELAGDQP